MGINRDIYEKLFDSQDKTLELVEKYKTIQSLKKEYINGERNRKELSKEIINKINEILPIIQSVAIDMQNIKEAVSCVDEISDANKLYDILIKLSNSENTQYGAKKINIISHGEVFTPYVIIAGEMSSINGIDTKKYYDYYSARCLLHDVISKEHSVIIEPWTEFNVIPSVDSDIDRLIFDLRDHNGVAYGYIFDDNLGKSMVKVYEYVKAHGGDMDNISVDTMVSRINEPEKQKVRKLTQTIVEQEIL